MPPVKIDPNRTALVVVDMQYLDAHPNFGIAAVAKERGKYKEFAWFFRRLPKVIRNQQRLIRSCRQKGIEVIFTRVSSLTKDGRDTGYFYSEPFPFVTPINSKEAQLISEMRVHDDDIVIEKTTDSAFNSQYNLDRILRNMGIQILIACGVKTNACLESTVRDACDLGYDVITVPDASLADTEAMHQVAIAELGCIIVELRAQIASFESWALPKERSQNQR
jgi:nicotinamidase-related amidase